MQDRDVAAPGGRIAERPHLVLELLVDRQGEDFGLVAETPQQIADAPRAVADRIASCAPPPATG